MGESLQLGPLVLPWGPLLLLGAWLAGDTLAQRQAARRQLPWGLHGWWLLAAALLVARAVFVLRYAGEYRAQPLSVLDIRDGGWSATAGALTALAGVGWLWLRRSPLARTATWGMALAMGLWLGGTALRWATAPQAATLPAFSGVALDARTVDLAALQGQPVVINLWASWCPPCRREMPAMLEAQRRHPGVRFVWVNQGEAPETVLRFASAQGLPPGQVLLDPTQALGRLLGHSALPTTVFFDAQGRQTAVRTGELSRATLADHLSGLLAAQPSDPPIPSSERPAP